MAASICLFSALVSFCFSDNTVYLLVEIFLSLQDRIEVVGFIRSLFWAKEADLYDVPDNLFKWLSVLFVHSQKHERQQNDNHNDGCRARVTLLHRKNSGTATAAPEPKQMSWRFVRLNITFVLTAFKSLGTGT